jgi:hypothetical protein
LLWATFPLTIHSVSTQKQYGIQDFVAQRFKHILAERWEWRLIGDCRISSAKKKIESRLAAIQNFMCSLSDECTSENPMTAESQSP